MTEANVGADDAAAAAASAPTYLHAPLITYAVMNFMADALLVRCFSSTSDCLVSSLLFRSCIAASSCGIDGGLLL
jgi:hypothetical protein